MSCVTTLGRTLITLQVDRQQAQFTELSPTELPALTLYFNDEVSVRSSSSWVTQELCSNTPQSFRVHFDHASLASSMNVGQAEHDSIVLPHLTWLLWRHTVMRTAL